MDESRQCTATSKQRGERCRRAAAVGRTVCVMHGGKAPLGPASPHWIDGRHSKILPKRLRADYQASLADPDKLALEAELAVIDARIQDVVSRVDTGESGRLWTELRQTWAELQRARRSGDPAAILAATREVGELITAGHQDWHAWSEVLALIERRRKLAESERKRRIEAQQMVHLDQAMAVIDLLVEAVRKHVGDPAILAAVTNEYARLTGVPVPTQAPSAPWSGRKRHPDA